MNTSKVLRTLPLVAALVTITLASPWALAGKPDWVDGHPGKGHDKVAQKADDRLDNKPSEASKRKPAQNVQTAPLAPALGVYFGDTQRRAIHDFYAPRVAAGKCPPGLAKKNNGCLPPGQAKKLWGIGQPLPASAVRYPLPYDLRRRLGEPPAGHEFVRVAGDILLIAIGTSMVVDAIEDLAGR